MNKKINTKIIFVIFVLILALAIWLIYWQVSRYIVSQDRVLSNLNVNQATTYGTANPASVFCEKQGGNLEIKTASDGGQIGYCVFANGAECEEWQYFRGECAPLDHLKTAEGNKTKKTTLKRVSVGERYTSYEGSITVSGRYQEYNPETMLGGILCFFADQKTGYLIPREPDFWGPTEPDTREPWFCFSNQEEARKQLGVDSKKIFANKTVECVSGPATVTVSHYITDKLESETYDKAQLDKVISYKKYSLSCER